MSSDSVITPEQRRKVRREEFVCTAIASIILGAGLLIYYALEGKLFNW